MRAFKTLWNRTVEADIIPAAKSFALAWRYRIWTCGTRAIVAKFREPQRREHLMRRSPRGAADGISYHHPVAFWMGVVAVTAGVALHLPMFVESRDMGFHMAGMAMGMPMMIGMFAILGGIAASLYGLVPPKRRASGERAAAPKIRALDAARIGPAHVGLLVVMA